jgi:hypothetical protein
VERVDGISRRVWKNAAGDDVIELYAIPGMAHGTPLATGTDEIRVAWQALICSKPEYHRPIISRGISAWAGGGMRVAFPENQPSALPATRRNPMPTASLGERLAGVGKIDIGAVIANALNAAGLTKSR